MKATVVLVADYQADAVVLHLLPLVLFFPQRECRLRRRRRNRLRWVTLSRYRDGRDGFHAYTGPYYRSLGSWSLLLVADDLDGPFQPGQCSVE